MLQIIQKMKWRDQKNFEIKSHKVEKKIKRGDILVSSGFANIRKSFWLRQGREPVTAGFPLNRLVEVTI